MALVSGSMAKVMALISHCCQVNGPSGDSTGHMGVIVASIDRASVVRQYGGGACALVGTPSLCINLLRIFGFFMPHYHIQISLQHIAGANNTAADELRQFLFMPSPRHPPLQHLFLHLCSTRYCTYSQIGHHSARGQCFIFEKH